MAFLLANWKWLLPTIGMVLSLGWGATAQIGWETCTAAAAKKVAAERQAQLDQKEHDRVLAGQISRQTAEDTARIDNTVRTATETIRYVQVTRDCAASPAMRAADDGILQLGFTRQSRPADAGNAPQTAGPAARPRKRDGQRAGRGAHPLRRRVPKARATVRRARLLRAGEAVLKVGR